MQNNISIIHKEFKNCFSCNLRINNDANVCPRCEMEQNPVKVPEIDYNSTEKGIRNRSTAIILALLLGWLGIHKFYLGETWQGVFYLIFYWTIIPLFLSLIGAFILILMDEDDFNSEYNMSIE